MAQGHVHKMKMMIDRGFTLIEAMVGSLLLSLSLLGVVGLMVYFSTGAADNKLRNCLMENALNGLSQLKANVTVNTTFTCGAASGTMSLSPSAFPAANACSDVTATAVGGGRTTQMTTRICNFQ
ncbi:MAG: hypothetical protein C0392_00370 [Syntrophus sp. (in: bacteria)]|nr:hypothetical protein [Syntrophus sp. (in: bacteria)]